MQFDFIIGAEHNPETNGKGTFGGGSTMGKNNVGFLMRPPTSSGKRTIMA